MTKPPPPPPGMVGPPSSPVIPTAPIPAPVVPKAAEPAVVSSSAVAAAAAAAEPDETPITPEVAASTLAVDDADDSMQREMAVAEMATALKEVPEIMARYFTAVGEDETIMDFAKIREELEGTKLATLRLEVEEKTPVLKSTAEAMVREAARREAVRRLDEQEHDRIVQERLDESLAAGRPFMIKGADIYSDVDMDWLVHERVPTVGIGQIVAPSYTGKTMVAIGMALSLANRKTDWWGHRLGYGITDKGVEDTREPVVVYVAEEGGAGFRQNVRAWLAENPSCNADRFLLVDEQGVDWTSPHSVETLSKAIDENIDHETQRLVLMVLDTQLDIMGDTDENSNVVGQIMSKIRQWSVKRGCFTFLLHHTPHGDAKRGRGSTSQMGKCDTTAVIVGESDATASLQLMWTKVKSAARPKTSETFMIRGCDVVGVPGAIAVPTTVTGILASVAGAAAAGLSAEKKLTDAILDAVSDAEKSGSPLKSKNEVAKVVSGGRSQILRITGSLVSGGYLVVSKGALTLGKDFEGWEDGELEPEE